MYKYILQIYSAVSDPLEQSLLENLFANYTPLERPVKDHREPLVVYLKFTLQQLIDIVSCLYLVSHSLNVLEDSNEF